MSARKWSKWPAPFKFGALTLCLLSIVLSTTLGWSWNTYNLGNASAPLPYESHIKNVLSSACNDSILKFKYTKIGQAARIDKTFLVTAKLANKKKQTFIVKILGQHRWLSHRKYIMNVYHLAGLAGIGPKVLFTDPEKGILILEYISGRHLNLLDIQNTTTLKELGKILRKYHETFVSIPLCDASNSLTVRVKNRLRELGENHSLYPKLCQMVDSYTPLTQASTVVHSDLKLSNILVTPQGRLYIIDWGEAHHGSPMIDLASLAHHGALSEPMEKCLTQAYFHRPLTTSEKADWLWYKNLSLLHTSAWALRESGTPSKNLLVNPKSYNKQRLQQLLHKFYQDGSLSMQELHAMGNLGILHFLESTAHRASNKSSLYIAPEIN